MTGLAKVVGSLADSFMNRRERAHTLAFLAGLKRDVTGAFSSAADPVTGQPWPALKYRTGRPLILSGTMMAEALSAIDRARPNGWGVTVDLVTPAYAGFHQRGTGRIPRRRFFGASPATVEAAGRQFVGSVVRVAVGGL